MSDLIVRSLQSGMYLANGEFNATRTEAYQFTGITQSVLETFLDGFFARETYEIVDYHDRLEFVHVHNDQTRKTVVAASVPATCRWSVVNMGSYESNIVRVEGPHRTTVTFIFAWQYSTVSETGPIMCHVSMLVETPRRTPQTSTWDFEQDTVENIEAAINDWVEGELAGLQNTLGRR